MSKKFNSSFLKIFLWILLLSLCYTLITVSLNYVQGGASDRIFHLMRLVENYTNLRQHSLTYIMTTTFGAAGQGINFFYPTGSLWPFLVSMLLIKNPIHALFWGTFLRTVIGFAASIMAMKLLKYSDKISFLFAVSYIFSTYLLYNAIPRFDLGEAMAVLFLPLVFASFYIVLNSKRNTPFAWLVLSVSLTLVTYSHLLTTVLTVCILFFLMIVYFIKNYGFNNLKNIFCQLLLAGITYILMTLGFWVPLVDQLIGTHIMHPELPYGFGLPSIIDPSFDEIIKVSLSNHIQNNGVTVGVLVLTGIVILGINFNKLQPKNKWMYMLGLLFLILSTDIMPWAMLAKTPLSVIQMPSRFIPFANLFLIYVIVSEQGRFLKVYLGNKKKVTYLIFLLMPILLAMGSCVIYFQQQHAVPMASKGKSVAYSWAKRVDSQANWFGMSGSIYDDYLPTATTTVKRHVNQGDILIDQQVISGKDTVRQPIPNGMVYQVKSLEQKTGKLTLPFWTYNKGHYVISINNGGEQHILNSKTNVASTMTTLQKGNNTVRIQFKSPVIYKIAKLISFISVLVGLFLLVWYQLFRKNHSIKIKH
ncbi:6-pyruvoyl-tetrahydropterin synthase-related protein [Convivina praedatoris]|uniref:Membrane protein 6-pyruvoyl-tetrahydropterin synthase-related domain-containing protein n=1 Tax=Convivina praedatoris TaxID=2880963 RepID=A0ABM9D267_9LACO|nr:6-pyruvoyl-tetrahydropterin synthase-related protein [Convivina sp. LMG 32447]CAH1850348.1 hypothetical protein R077815_00114 [Convivina sp. LMG 32447]CAH1850355.1 hypothetical protein LMG032447_00116 [Convivina sp. LMG 32447]CAH1850853.1 hypothetical protein R078138_00216 [Convivina sp. LMG 32447]